MTSDRLYRGEAMAEFHLIRMHAILQSQTFLVSDALTVIDNRIKCSQHLGAPVPFSSTVCHWCGASAHSINPTMFKTPPTRSSLITGSALCSAAATNAVTPWPPAEDGDNGEHGSCDLVDLWCNHGIVAQGHSHEWVSCGST